MLDVTKEKAKRSSLDMAGRMPILTFLETVCRKNPATGLAAYDKGWNDMRAAIHLKLTSANIASVRRQFIGDLRVVGASKLPIIDPPPPTDLPGVIAEIGLLWKAVDELRIMHSRLAEAPSLPFSRD